MDAIAIKFTRWDVSPLETLKQSKVYELRERLNAGERISREEKNWITAQVNNNPYFKSAIPLRGYRFDFSDVLKTYLVKQYGRYIEYRAIDKTSLRAMLYGRVERIIQI